MWNWRTRYRVWDANRKVFLYPENWTEPDATAVTLATQLGRDLYRVDLTEVVSKHVGETEKNLRRVFASARKAGAVLLFDEADALFGKRGVAPLLKRIQRFDGLVLLATNRRRRNPKRTSRR